MDCVTVLVMDLFICHSHDLPAHGLWMVFVNGETRDAGRG